MRGIDLYIYLSGPRLPPSALCLSSDLFYSSSLLYQHTPYRHRKVLVAEGQEQAVEEEVGQAEGVRRGEDKQEEVQVEVG